MLAEMEILGQRLLFSEWKNFGRQMSEETKELCTEFSALLLKNLTTVSFKEVFKYLTQQAQTDDNLKKFESGYLMEYKNWCRHLDRFRSGPSRSAAFSFEAHLSWLEEFADCEDTLLQHARIVPIPRKQKYMPMLFDQLTYEIGRNVLVCFDSWNGDTEYAQVGSECQAYLVIRAINLAFIIFRMTLELKKKQPAVSKRFRKRIFRRTRIFGGQHGQNK
jgi:hypothetical protein